MHNVLTNQQGSFSVENPEISEVLDLQTGEHLSHQFIIGNDYAKICQLRLELQTLRKRETPRFACSLCGTPVYLVSLWERRRFFFRHALEDGRCSARTRGDLSQAETDALKYDGVKESQRHLDMKKWLAQSLEADPKFSQIATEKRWSTVTKEWRRPDVRAMYQGTPVVFEIQLSTTYVNIIAERRDFYLREGGVLLWIFANFDVSARRLTQDDIFYNNNRNAFLVSAATRDESLRQNRFLLECFWAVPTSNGVEDLQHRLVPFDELTLEQDQQRAYFFDFDNAQQALRRQAQDDTLLRRGNCREKFEAWWLSNAQRDQLDVEGWANLKRECSSNGIALSSDFYDVPRPLINALYSAKYGRVIGWKLKKLIEVAHLIEEKHKSYLGYFRRALSAYMRGDQIVAEDVSGRWRKKVNRYKPLIAQNDPAYAPDRAYENLVEFLFPEILEKGN